MKKRYNNYDLLRVISCFAVIIIHVSARYRINLNEENIFSILLWNIIPRFVVPCFLVLSGAFLLDDDRNYNYNFFIYNII